MARTEDIERRSARLTQLTASIGLSALFLVVYGWCNWFTAQRSNVPTLFFEWERFIPFVPLMIAPYMSIDLFFVAAPFLCRTHRELATFSKRIAAAIVIGGVCFLLFPLRFAFERPHAAGWLGALFDWFRAMDQPYNLLPSLHIALRTILAEFYARHSRGVLRYASNIWFVLIGLSAVLTYQHHVMDVVGGFALGAYCLYLFPGRNSVSDALHRERAPSLQQTNKNPRVGSYYLAGAAVLMLLAILWWPWGAFVLWPALSLAIASAAYFGLGPGIFRKARGKLPWTTWFVLWPVLLGHEISRRYYRRHGTAWNELTPRLWIGGLLSRSEAIAVVGKGVSAVLDLTAEFSEPRAFREVTYENIPVLDLTAPTVVQMDRMADFIDRESSRGVVYLHCKIGYSRTAAVAAAYLLHGGLADTIPDAIDRIRRIRPSVVIRPEVLRALNEFAAHRLSSRPVAQSSNNRRTL